VGAESEEEGVPRVTRPSILIAAFPLRNLILGLDRGRLVVWLVTTRESIAVVCFCRIERILGEVAVVYLLLLIFVMTF
jgi:hypothetical protein